MHAEFRQLQSYLPGGDKPLLATIGVPEYSNFPTAAQAIKKPLSWIRLSTSNPMVAVPGCETYSSIREFQIQQRVGAVMTDWEGSLELQPLRSGLIHQAKIFKVGGFAVVGINLNKDCRIVNANGKSRKPRLPHELEINARFSPSAGDVLQFRGYHDARMTGLPRHDAFFVVTSHTTDDFGSSIINDPSNDGSPPKKVHNLIPHQNSFLLTSILETVDSLPEEQFKKWHPFILCQNFEELREVDVLKDIEVPEEQKTGAIRWARNAVPWNHEQLQVLDALHCAKGRVIACTGIAGTGKTTLQMVLALLFVKLGGRALCTAPANSNGDHLVKNMIEFVHDIIGLRSRIYRLYSASKGMGLREMTKQQASYRRAGHSSGNVSSLSDFKFAMWARKNRDKVNAWDCSVQNAVFEEVQKGELQWVTTISNTSESGKEVYKTCEVWAEFRKHLEHDHQGRFAWRDYDLSQEIDKLYETCKGHLIMLADVIITTNGNSRAKELVQFWAKASERHEGILVKAFGLFLDETAKDQEINVWNVITSDGLPKEPDVVVLFGDPKQLPPTNTCSTKPQYNPFAVLNDISILSRLIGEGFPSINLREQQRMHPALSSFVSDEFYDGKLRDSPRVMRDLDAAHPGLRRVLAKILAQSYTSQQRRNEFMENAKDEQLRLQYIQMPNGDEKDLVNTERKSIAVTSHVNIFLDKMFPQLQRFFGANMEKEVLIICGYSAAIKLYDDKIHQLKKASKLAATHFPRVLTIDASQGQEASMIIVDGSMRFSDTMGFMKDRGRSNVALTRAKNVLWILGGSLEKQPLSRARLAPPAPFVKLKEKLQKTGQVHKFT